MCALFAAGLRQRSRVFIKSCQHSGCYESDAFRADGRRYFADRGPLRKDYTDPGFRKKGYIDPTWFGNTLPPKRDKRKSDNWGTDSYQRPKERRNVGNARRDFEGRTGTRPDCSDYPYTGSRLDEFSNRGAGRWDTNSSVDSRNSSEVESFKNRWSGNSNREGGREEFLDRGSTRMGAHSSRGLAEADHSGKGFADKEMVSNERQARNADDSETEDELTTRDRLAIRKTLADDAEDTVTSFHRSQGRLFDISGDMAEDFQPSQQDEHLVFEMACLFKQGNVAPWEAEDVVRTNGGLLRPYHVFEVLKSCKVDCGVALAFFRWAGLQSYYQHVTATYNMMLKLLEESEKYTEMAELSREMDNFQVAKSAVTFKILLVSFFKGGMVEEALDTFSQMERSLTPPSFAEYKYVIDRMLSVECYFVVPVLFKSLTVAGHTPDSYTYNAVISSLCNVAKMDEALQVLASMKDKCSSDIFTYSILIDGFIKCHKVGMATSLFLEMLGRGCLPGEDIFNLLFGLHAKAGEIEQAVDLFRKIVGHGCQPTVKSYGMLLDTFARADNMDGAYTFFKELIDKGTYPSVISCNALLSKLSKSGKTSLALKFFEDMKSIPEWKPNAITYNTAIDLLAKTGKYEEAWKAFSDMKANGCTPCLITYNTLILRLGRAGQIETCFSLFEEMKGRGFAPNQYTYSGLIEVLTRYNQVDQALGFLEEMKSLDYNPNASTLQLVIKTLWTSGNLVAAKKLCEEHPGVYTLRLESRPWNVAITDGGGPPQLSESEWR